MTEQPEHTKFSSNIIQESRTLIDNGHTIVDYGGLCTVDVVSEYSSLLPGQFIQVYEVISRIDIKKKNKTVLDACAHIGVDSIMFSFMGFTCVSVEVDETAYKCLEYNIKTSAKGKTNKTFLCNYLDFIQDVNTKFDIIYFDPPWGGKEYYKEKYLMLYLSRGENKVPIYDIINDVFDRKLTDTVVLKVPSNFNMKEFGVKTKNIKFGIKIIYKPKKKKSQRRHVAFYLLVCTYV